MIISVVDDTMIPEVKSLIASCAVHAPDQPFHLFLVNPDAYSRRVGELYRLHPNISINQGIWPSDKASWHGLMCCAKAAPILYCLEEYKEPILYLDADTIVRGPLDEIWDTLKICDLMIKYRPELNHIGPAGTPLASKFNGGVIAIAPSTAGIEFANKYYQRITEWIKADKPTKIWIPEGKVFAYIDQELLYLIHLETGTSFFSLPHKFNDAKFLPSSIIWHGKGTARNNAKYRRERLRYTNKLAYQLFPFTNMFTRLVNKRTRIISTISKGEWR